MADLTLHQKYDILIHLIEESDETEESRLLRIQELFPKYNPENPYNEEHVDEYVIFKYSEARSLGMSVSDSAHSAEVSEKLMLKASEGEGLTLPTFLQFAKAELYSAAMKLREHLVRIGSGDKGYKASLALLEKMYPDQYGAKVTVNDEASAAVASSNMEVARRLSFILTKAMHTGKSTTNDDRQDKVRRIAPAS
jgi:hypothetical protein